MGIRMLKAMSGTRLDPSPGRLSVPLTPEYPCCRTSEEERPPTARRNERIEASWDAPWYMSEQDAWLGYIVEVRGPGTGGWFEEGVCKGTSATIVDLENGETHDVRVTAFNLYGQATAGPKTAIPRVD